jgi:hypothetical protein
VSARPDRRALAPILGAILLLYACQIYAFHWGVILPDTIEQYRQALSGQYEDWHPPIMAWLWRMLGVIAPGSAPFLLLDCTLYWIGIGCIAVALRRRGQPGAAWGAILIGALPISFGQMGSILKDALLLGSLTAATGLIALDLLQGRPIARWRAVAAGLLILLASAVRLNGIVAAAPLLLLAVAPGVWRRPAWGIAGFVVAGIALALGGWAINDGLLQPRHTHPLLSVYHLDVAGISVRSGHNVYPAPQPDLALVRSCYTPWIYNPHNLDVCGDVEDRFFKAGLQGPRGGTALWLDAIRAEPLAYLRHRTAHFNATMRWWVPTVPNDAIYTMSQPNELGLGFTANPLTKAIFAAASWMAQSPLGRPATWMAVALGLLLLVFMPAKDGSRSLIATLAFSALLYGGAYAVAGVAPDLRYNNWTMMAAMLALLLALADPARPPGRRWAIAALPPVLVILGEVAAMLSA